MTRMSLVLRASVARAVVVCAALLFAAAFAGPAGANPKYAGIVIDANTGKTLYNEAADKKRFPASLTKIMTLYVVFEELEAGRLRLGTKMRASKYAAGRPPSKIGIGVGGTITVRDAMKALVTKSANDVSVVIAEHISGSEAAFAKRMTKTARRLGMKKTTFRNANGLPNRHQVTTARDMATLGLAVQRDFPQYYGIFNTTVFKYGKKRYRNHNRLLGRVKGVDGIKTGFIRASGFNLVTNVRRDGKHIVAVVMGGRTGKRRNDQMKSLIGRYLPKATRGAGMVQMAFRNSDPPPLPRMKPAPTTLLAARFKERTAEPDAIGEALMAFAAAPRAVVVPQEDRDALTSVVSFAAANAAGVDVPPVALTRSIDARVSTAPPTPPEADAPAHFKLTSVPATDGSASAARFATAFETAGAADSAGQAVQGILNQRAVRAAFVRTRETVPAPSATARAPQSADQPVRPVGPQARAAVPPGGAAAAADGGPWQIQVGAVGSRREAKALLTDAAGAVAGLDNRERVTIPVATQSGTLYRARFAGFSTEQAATAACKRFANHNRPCWAVSM